MGNRHEQDITPIINPPETPYLHVIRLANSQGEYDWTYAAQLSGLGIEIGKSTLSNGSVVIEDSVRIHIELLDKPTIIPPPQVDAPVLVRTRISEKHEEIMAALKANPQADIIGFSHGYAWGLEPERVVAELISAQYQVGGVFKIGGRKKMQINAYQIRRNI